MLWQEAYNLHICDKFAEVELRVGKQTSSGFNTNVGSTVYNKVLSQLNTLKWDSVDEYEIDDFYYKGNIRKSGNIIIQKENIYKSNKKCGNVDIRLAINTEKPVTKTIGGIQTTRKKYRKSFSKQFYRFDVTHIKNDDTYEIEMELIGIDYAKKHSYEFIIENMLKKLTNLISSANF